MTGLTIASIMVAGAALLTPPKWVNVASRFREQKRLLVALLKDLYGGTLPASCGFRSGMMGMCLARTAKIWQFVPNPLLHLGTCLCYNVRVKGRMAYVHWTRKRA